jgi:hypothetical protein
MPSSRPGFRSERLIHLMDAAIRRCELDLSGTAILTEAASGAYVVTPVLAALAGAQRVFAVTYPSAYGTVEEIARTTLDLAELAGVSERIEILSAKRAEIVAPADIVTNNGHVRPIDAEVVGWMKPTAVIPLMYEAWELRAGDIDLAACRQRGIPVAGTNERHPAVDVFSFLGVMAMRMLLDAGVAVYGTRVLVWCDNPFGPFLVQQLTQAGAVVQSVNRLEDTTDAAGLDAILVALRPRAHPVVGRGEAEAIARRSPTAIVCQFWGDVDRAALARCGVPFWPVESPPPGHQGILPSSVGPEPIVRLQAGGLKVGEVMARVRMSKGASAASHAEAIATAVASGYGQALSASAPRGLTSE